ncbi:hypothetical protein ABB02_01711 [Clostridiaceae bacterium JG1575]|nr:hypothetical protein ABB02_01711 [Clostridiaceae bacterium JG1575]
MNCKRLTLAALALGTLLGSMLGSVSTAHAELKKADTPWSRPTFVYGAGLSEKDVLATANALGTAGENLLQMPIDGSDILRYIGVSSPDGQMISSALVRKLKSGQGIVVDIKTPENITQITKVDYANAAITAGAKDLQISVASIYNVTGASALTGVYKALEANGVKLDRDRMVVAQKELNTVNAITQENKDKKEFDKKNLDQLIINIKNELNLFINNSGNNNTITRSQVEEIVQNAAKANHLSGVLSNDQMRQLTSLFDQYAKTDAIRSSDVVAQLKTLSNDVMQKAKDWYGEAKASGLLDRILQFLKGILNAIVGFFQWLISLLQHL